MFYFNKGGVRFHNSIVSATNFVLVWMLNHLDQMMMEMMMIARASSSQPLESCLSTWNKWRSWARPCWKRGGGSEKWWLWREDPHEWPALFKLILVTRTWFIGFNSWWGEQWTVAGNSISSQFLSINQGQTGFIIPQLLIYQWLVIEPLKVNNSSNILDDVYWTCFFLVTIIGCLQWW